MPTRKEFTSRSINAKSYWESLDVASLEALGDYTAEITVPKNTFVEEVIALVISRPIVTTGTAVLVVGDAADADGFLKVQDITSHSLEGALVTTYFGNDLDDLGEYLVELHSPEDFDYSDRDRRFPVGALHGKFFASGTSIISKVTIGTAVASSNGRVRIWVKMLELMVEED